MSELFDEVGSDFLQLLSLSVFDLGALRSLGDVDSGLFLSRELRVLLSRKRSGVVRLVPLN